MYVENMYQFFSRWHADLSSESTIIEALEFSEHTSVEPLMPSVGWHQVKDSTFIVLSDKWDVWQWEEKWELSLYPIQILHSYHQNTH